MVVSNHPPANNFVRTARKVYNPLGFNKGYNFVLFFIFGGALMGFVLARLQYLSIDGVFCPSASNSGTQGGASPGECYWYAQDRYRIGISLHLAGILPAAFLVVFQFIPAIRHKALLYHRMAGYIIILLVLISIVGALMIANRAFGGALATQTAVGVLAIGSLFGLFNAYYNIKRLQIDQHRAWMLRVWAYMGSIITLRLIQILAALVISAYTSYGFYQIIPCAELLFEASPSNQTLATEYVYKLYPVCNPLNAAYTTDAQAIVKATFNGRKEQIGASLDLAFPMAIWLALILHAVGVELYLAFTPKEAERLRNVSYERQLERGMKNPGSAGLVPEKIGDMEPWRSVQDGGKAVKSEERTAEIESLGRERGGSA